MKKKNIFLAGHNGMAGSAVLRLLKTKKKKYNILIKDKKQLDLTDQRKVYNFFKNNKIDSVILCAAKVGGILANSKYGGEFIFNNLAIQNNIFEAAKVNHIKNLIFLGSSCIYPKFAKQPIKENYLLTGKLEESNEPYAIAKIAGVKMCEAYNKQFQFNYKCLMPCNMFGPNDNYDDKNSHFFPALIKKIYKAKKNKKNYIKLWGTGKAKREVLYVDDLANACLFFLEKKTKHYLINIGSGIEHTISDYAKIIMKKFDIKLKIKFSGPKMDGTPRKLLNTKLAKKYGWNSKINLDKALDLTIDDFIKNKLYK